MSPIYSIRVRPPNYNRIVSIAPFRFFERSGVFSLSHSFLSRFGWLFLFFQKNFSEMVAKRLLSVGISERVISTPIRSSPFAVPWKLNIQVLRTLFLMISHHNGYAKTSYIGQSENPRYNYQVAPDTAMTVRMIMILLYGAGGEPGWGEIPMKRWSTPLPMYFPCKGRRGQILHRNIRLKISTSSVFT